VEIAALTVVVFTVGALIRYLWRHAYPPEHPTPDRNVRPTVRVIPAAYDYEAH
jgi:hypothetical protein